MKKTPNSDKSWSLAQMVGIPPASASGSWSRLSPSQNESPPASGPREALWLTANSSKGSGGTASILSLLKQQESGLFTSPTRVWICSARGCPASVQLLIFVSTRRTAEVSARGGPGRLSHLVTCSSPALLLPTAEPHSTKFLAAFAAPCPPSGLRGDRRCPTVHVHRR